MGGWGIGWRVVRQRALGWGAAVASVASGALSKAPLLLVPGG
ncbi:MAG: hypothetical protein JWM30_998 [Burkholderia sp.]|nr:hypothetical protein [Burkholderia sp.]